jgi:hypothetical protein
MYSFWKEWPDGYSKMYGETSGFDQVAQNLLKLNVVIRSLACVTLL